MGVLDGVKVLELAEFGFVPSCGAILADWGADVVKVERPQGDPLRLVQKAGLVADTGDFELLWEQINRNKRGITLDLRTDDGRAALDQLLVQADVLITSFLPSSRKRLRIEPDDVWKVNPRLIYARGHGQGQAGPDADSGGFDSVSYWARGGLAHVLTPPEGPLIMQRAAMGDGPSGAFLAGGVAAALYQREKTGVGSIVDVSLLGTAVWTLAPDLATTTILGVAPPPIDSSAPLSTPLIGTYRTRDGRWLMLNMMDDTRHWAPVCRALGLASLVDRPEYADTAARSENRASLHATITEAIANRDLADLRAALLAEDTIFSAMATPEEVVADPQVAANGYLARHPDHDRARLAAGPCQFGGEHLVIRRRAPHAGEHTDEVLAEAGLAPAAIDGLRTSGALG
jgi:crotonobetainyl-CoA:carnitine CoA-transferase CaiB-like acyl-CoA transferase